MTRRRPSSTSRSFRLSRSLRIWFLSRRRELVRPARVACAASSVSSLAAGGGMLAERHLVRWECISRTSLHQARYPRYRLHGVATLRVPAKRGCGQGNGRGEFGGGAGCDDVVHQLWWGRPSLGWLWAESYSYSSSYSSSSKLQLKATALTGFMSQKAFIKWSKP